jgi:hypothetical protein
MRPGHERLLYQGGSARPGYEIRVTTRWCVVNGTRYPISDLSALATGRGRRELGSRDRIVALAGLAAVLVVVCVAIGTGWTRQIWIALAAAILVTVAVSVLPAVLGVALRRPYQIWARYQDAPVLLFVTEDPEQHGQVARALLRARESQDPWS